MFLRSSCSRNECGAPKGSQNYSSRKHRVARFTTSGVYIESTESDTSELQDNAHGHCCHHHHNDFLPNVSLSQLSSKSISPIPKVPKGSSEHSFKNGRSSFSLRSCSHDSRISSSDTLNYSYSEFDDTMPIPDIMNVTSNHTNSGYSNRRLSSTPIIEHKFLSTSKFWKSLKSLRRPPIHNPDTGNGTSELKAKYSKYPKKCYDYVVYCFEKVSHFNTKATIPNIKVFNTKKIAILFSLLLLLATFCYMCQNSKDLLQLSKFFPVHGANYLSRALLFFIPFLNNRNDLSLASDVKAMDDSLISSPAIGQKEIDRILFDADKLSLSQGLNISEIKSWVTKLVHQELDDLQLFKNWQDEKFFLRQEIDHIQKDFVEYKSEFETLLEPLKDIAKLSDKLQGLETFTKQEEDKLNKKLGEIEKSIQKLNASNQATSASYKDVTHKIYTLQRDITSFLKYHSDQNGTIVHSFQDQLSSDLIHTETLKLHSAIVKTSTTLQEMKDHIEFLQSELESIKSREANRYTIMDMEKIITKAILLYDADKTGQVDYALESAGGIIVKHSPSYLELSTIFGFRLWSCSSSGPRLAIQPSTYPGHCWAMKGRQGFIVIKLAYAIWPTSFVMEHAPISNIPTGSINSAPKDFSVYGLLSSEGIAGKLLGNYSFDINGNSLQYFPVQFNIDLPFDSMELKIHSNYGNFNYTCLYRFRVHGIRHFGGDFSKDVL